MDLGIICSKLQEKYWVTINQKYYFTGRLELVEMREPDIMQEKGGFYLGKFLKYLDIGSLGDIMPNALFENGIIFNSYYQNVKHIDEFMKKIF
jgi:hypothetical protein